MKKGEGSALVHLRMNIIYVGMKSMRAIIPGEREFNVIWAGRRTYISSPFYLFDVESLGAL